MPDLASVQLSQALSDGFAAEIRGRTFHIKGVRDWPLSAYKQLQAGDFDGWARKCLVGDDLPAWDEVDPTIGELNDMIEQANAALGASSGKSLPS